MTDTTIRRLAAASVLLVAAIAAVVSFLHIRDLAISHGGDQLAAALLPLLIDGTVAAMSLAMLLAARLPGVRTPWLARFMLALAVGATLAANMAYGAAYGIAGALLWTCPAVFFVGCVEVSIGMVRRTREASAPEDARQPRTMDTVPPAPVAAPEPAHQPETHRAPVSTRKPAQRRERRAISPADVTAHFGEHVPSENEVMKQMRVSRPTAKSLLASLAEFEPEPVGAVSSNGHGKVEA